MPTPTRIEKLVLNGFRGATCPVEVTFDTNKPTVLIFGENGTGKSTVVDALDFVCNQEYGSLTDKSSVTPKSHLPALGCKAKDVSVSLSYGSQVWTGRMATAGPNVSGPIGRPTARILRRSQLLRVVNEQPKKRYEALQSFITVPQIEICEQSLRDASKSVDRELDEAVRAKQQATDTLSQLWQNEGSPAEDALAWAKSKAKQDPAVLKTNVTGLNAILTELASCITARGSITTAEATHAENERKRQESKAKLSDAQAKTNQQDQSLIDVLQDALNYLKQDGNVIACPVCEQSVQGPQLQERISVRLDAMKELVALKNAAEQTKRNAEGSSAVLNDRRADFVQRTRRLATVLQKSEIEEIASLGIDRGQFAGLLGPTSDTTDPTLMPDALGYVTIVEAAQRRLANKRDTDQKTLNQLNAIRGHVYTVAEKSLSAVELDRLSKRLRAFLEIVERHRKAYVEGVLSTVSSIVENLYSRIHPGEDIGKVRFYLKPKVIGSLEFDGQFQTETDVPPQAYYSESHLDTLGVCVFLALAKHFNDSNTIVVLDDVVTSVDHVHMERFMQVLHDEAANFNQLIITTHYRPWRDRYRFARGPAANVHLIELLHWSLPRGIRHTKTKLSVDELRDWSKTEPLERQVVASKAGILLESLLDHLALLYRTKLPRQAEPNYTLGDLTGSIAGKLAKAMRIEKIATAGTAATTVELYSLLNDIAEMAWIRNQVGCHFNITGMSVGDSDVRLLAQRTTLLADALVCANCGELPLRNRSGSYWECQCSQTQLHPLVSPGDKVS